MDGMRHVAADLWSRLSEPDRHEFLRRHATAWNLRRHRVPPATAATIASLRHAKRLHVEPATLIHAAPVPGPAIQVTLTNGKTLKVDWVVNCTGPARDHSRLRLHVDAVHATAGMGLRTLEGRVLDRRGSAARPIWAVGALRRGELWESTAVPEIRAQVSQVVTAALNVAPASSGTTPLVRPSEARRDPFYTKLVK